MRRAGRAAGGGGEGRRRGGGAAASGGGPGPRALHGHLRQPQLAAPPRRHQGPPRDRGAAAGEGSRRELEERVRTDAIDASVPLRALGGGSDAAGLQMQRVEGGRADRAHGAARGGGGRARAVLAAAAGGRGRRGRGRVGPVREPGGGRRRHGAAPGGAARARGLRAPAGRRAGVPGRADAALRGRAHGGHRRREHAAALRGVRRRGPVLPGARVPRRRPHGRQLQRVARRGRGPDVEVQLAGARAGAQVAAPRPQVPALRLPLPPAPLPPRRRPGLRRLAGILRRRRRRQRRRRLLRLPRETLQRRRRSVRARAVPQVRDGPVHGDEGVRNAGAGRHRAVPALPERHRLLQEGRRRSHRGARGRPPEHEQRQPPLLVRPLPGPPRQRGGGRGGEEHMPVFRRPEVRRRCVGRPGGRHSSLVLRSVHRPLRHLVLRTNGSMRLH